MKAILVLLVLALAVQSALAVDVDLGDLNVRNPRIMVNFTDPARLDVYRLTDITGARVYPLCVQPTALSTTFERHYDLYTTTATDAACSGGTPQYLIPGEYLLALQGSGVTGNRTPLYTFPFRVSGLEISIISPASNISPVRPPRLVFATTKLAATVVGETPNVQLINSTCRYATSISKPWAQVTFTDLRSSVGNGESSMHAIEIDYQGDIYIICKESAGAGQEAKHIARIAYDLTPPKITGVTRAPSLVTALTGSKGLSRITLTTDEKSACSIIGDGIDAMFHEELQDRYETYRTTHDTVLEYDPLVVGTTEKNFSYDVRCVNLAGTANMTSFNITVDFRHAMSIQVLAPQEITNKTSFELLVRPVLMANPAHAVRECYVNDDGSKSTGTMTRRQVPDGNGGTVTLFAAAFSFNADGSQDGRKAFNITCYDEKVMSIMHHVMLDSRMPSAPVINASGFICSNMVHAQFNATDAGGIAYYAYTVSDSTGVLATNTTISNTASVTLQRAVNGPLTWQVHAVDFADNKGPVSTVIVPEVRTGIDEECGLPPFITLRSPGMGHAEELPYDFSVQTSRPATCRYSLLGTSSWNAMAPLATSDNRLHSKEDLSHAEQRTYYVACNESNADRLHRKQFAIGVDASAPKIAIKGVPNPVVDRSSKVVSLIITTDDRAFCTIDGAATGSLADNDQSAYTTTHAASIDYRSINDVDLHEFTYEIACRNLALVETLATYDVVVHFGAPFTIEILSPAAYTANDDVTLRIRPSKMAVCSWERNGTIEEFTVSNGTHTSYVGTLAEGTHTIPISCIASDEEAKTIAEFTIDKTVPEITGIEGPALICAGDAASFAYTVSTLDEDLFITYTIESSNTSGEFNTTDDIIVLETSALQPDDYTLLVEARNRANATSTPAAAEFRIVDITHAACTLPENHCSNSQQDVTEDGIDCGGSCPACLACEEDFECGPGEVCANSVCAPTVLECTTDNDCTIGEICQQGMCVESTGCVSNSDCSYNEQCVQSVCISTAACSTNNDCGVDEICSGGTCIASEQSDGCVSDYECLDGQVCSSGVCAAAPAEDEEGHLLSIALIVLGLAIMGGAGYFLYQQHAEQRPASPPMMPVQRPGGQLSPPIAARYEQDSEARQQALAQEYARRQEERSKREQTFKSFGDAPVAPQQTQAAKSSPAQEMQKPKDEEGYVELGAIKSRADARKKKGDDDAFDKLDKL